MPWPGCSSPGSRKSPVRTLATLLLVLCAPNVAAQIQHEVKIEETTDHLSISMTAAGADVEELFATLQEGLRVRVQYRIRVTQPRERPFQVLGDRLVQEFRSGREAYWDPFLMAYVVTDDEGWQELFRDEATMYSEFFVLRDYRIPWTDIPSDRGLAVEASAEYTPIVFVPGLSILSLFTATSSEASHWSRHELSTASGLP